MRHNVKLLLLVGLILVLGANSFAQAISCNGGAQKAVRVRTNNVATTTTSSTFAVLPGASIMYALPANTTDTFVVTFSAEARLFGNTSPNNWLELEVRDNGVAMQPRDATSPLAFKAADLWESQSASFCKRITNSTSASVNHTFTVNWKVTNNSGAASLTAWLDDWTLHLEVSN